MFCLFPKGMFYIRDTKFRLKACVQSRLYEGTGIY